MSLDSVLRIAAGGLANINSQMALVSQNVTNAATPDYARESGVQTSLTAGDQGMGVVTGAARRQIDTALQAAAFQQGSDIAGLTARQTALQAIDTVLGTPGQGGDLSSLLGDLRGQFSTLMNNPDNQTQRQRAVTAAVALARGINTLSGAYTAQRQAAQDDIVASVDTLNATLGRIGGLSNQIIVLKSGRHSTADLENQRAAAVHTLSDLIGIRTQELPSGDLLLATASGSTMPTRGAVNPFAATGASVPPGASHAGGAIPGITLNGTDVTNRLTGGRIGGDLALRDSVLPAYQGELDEFAQTLAARFDAQGLTLFTGPTAAVPAGGGVPVQSGYVGFAAIIQVNPAVQANPSLIRDGTSPVPGTPTGPSAFTPNPPGGPAGFTTMIERVLNYALGALAQPGVAQPSPRTIGLGPDGQLAAPFMPPASLADFAAALTGSQAADSASTTASLGTGQALLTSLNARLTAVSGVNMDQEMAAMITLQNAYGANARIISTAQTLFDQILGMVR